ncbi:MAG: DUF4350 domain-containing protein [Acidobacteria bacterium]|nr:DUF4350 domain-containing protein [Acidobacteriota bacterium]
MKQRLAMLFVFLLVITVLIGLNAASYQQKQKTQDSEATPNRSSYNSGATGTQAWYTLLSETGRKVIRWQESTTSLSTSKASPSVFVVVGTVRRDFTDKETQELLSWVADGGRLVLIDRDPPKDLAVTTADWKITIASAPRFDILSTDPADRQQMTGDVAAVHPSQPSVYTQGVNAVQFSKFAEKIELTPHTSDVSTISSDEPPPRGKLATRVMPAQDDPDDGLVVQVSGSGRNFVADAPYGSGHIIFVSDPYIVSNGGISLADNARLATNLVATSSGAIAFDEFHQGYSSDSNKFLEFFAGTPVVAIFLQGLCLVGLVFYSRSRRFARPLPAREPDRLSKLEYVTAMAELQQRTRAWDLAIENIYGEFRRRAARLFGLDVAQASSDILAKRIAERTDLNAAAVRDTLFKCEEIIRGERTGKTEVIRLADAIREIEQKLNLQRGRAAK